MVEMKLSAYMPLFLVFMSGIGFSIQGLIVKVLEEHYNFHASFQLVMFRGLVQTIFASCVVYRNKLNGETSTIFGPSRYVSGVLLLRTLCGFGGMSFVFLAIEHMAMADASVLFMQSPIIASILGYLVLGEPWKLAEFCATILSLVGTVFITRPPFVFGDNGDNSSAQYSSTADRWGPVYGVLSAVCAGCVFVTVRMLGTTAKMPWANVSLAQALGQFVLAGPAMLISGQGVHAGGSVGMWVLIMIGGVIATVSQFAMTIGMQREKSASASAMRASDVFFAFLWQSAFTRDGISPLSVVGACLVVAGVMVIVFFKDQTLAAEAKALEVRGVDCAGAKPDSDSGTGKDKGTAGGGGGLVRTVLASLNQTGRSLHGYQPVSRGSDNTDHADTDTDIDTDIEVVEMSLMESKRGLDSQPLSAPLTSDV